MSLSHHTLDFPNKALLWDLLPGVTLSSEEAKKQRSEEVEEAGLRPCAPQLSWGFSSLGAAMPGPRRVAHTDVWFLSTSVPGYISIWAGTVNSHGVSSQQQNTDRGKHRGKDLVEKSRQEVTPEVKEGGRQVMKCSHKTHLLSAAPQQEAMLSSYTRVFFTPSEDWTWKLYCWMRGSVVSEHLGLSYVSAMTLITSLNSSLQYSWKDLLSCSWFGKGFAILGLQNNLGCP